MDTWKRRTEIAANITIVAIGILIAVIAIHKFFMKSSSPDPQRGMHVSIPGMDWTGGRQTLVLAVSTHCQFCRESAGFYKTLIPIAQKSNIQVVAVLPQSTIESQKFFQQLGIPAIQVRQEPLSSLRVRGTPTILLVDKKGAVVRSWVGMLPPQGQREVLASVE